MKSEVCAAPDGHGRAQEDHPHEAEPRDLVVPLEGRVHHVAAPDAEEDVGHQHRHEHDADALDEHGYFAAALASAMTRSKSSLPTLLSTNFQTGCARSWNGRRSLMSLTCTPRAFICARPSASALTSSCRCCAQATCMVSSMTFLRSAGSASYFGLAIAHTAAGYACSVRE